MRGHVSFLFSVIILGCIFNSCLLGCAAKSKNDTDRLALLAFKDAITMDPNGVFDSWNVSFHHCHWQGILCSRKHRQRVIALNLSSQGLIGPLSSHVGNLSFLRIINLQDNNFHGEIPPEIGKLFRLLSLNLNDNSFQGHIPTNLTNCISLYEISVIGNNLTGKLPVEFGSIPNLAALGLGKNNFKGNIPPSLGNFSSLILLNLEGARLEGSIPEDIGRIARLQYLIFAENNLTGSIPSSIFNLSSLIILGVASNQLEGILPADIGITMPNLQWLGLGGNRFTGSIPISLSNASKLQKITFSYNSFSGPVPVELGTLVNLSWLALYSNMLGTRGGNDLGFISSLTNCTRLEKLYLGENLLKGPITKSIANLSTQISHLSLGANQIYGTIPSGIGNLVNLNLLDMNDMMLHRKIPDEIGFMQNLSLLYAGGNELSDQIPSTIGNLTRLYILSLRQNKLSGNITPSIKNCQKLWALDLSQNDLESYVPASLFRLPSISLINLSHNCLIGSLPPDVGNLKQLETLDVSQNKLSGGIPSTLGSCLMLMNIIMSNNSFEGLIPQELSALRGLVELDLSHNNLSGTIPEYLGRLPFLQKLNLSFNNLHGKVPETGVFKNVSLISLIANKKLCGGIPELKLPVCTVFHSNEKGISLALIASFIIIFAVCIAPFGGFLIFHFRKSKSKGKPSSASLNYQFIQISYQELVRATDGFSDDNLIGSGSFGSVYKGFLHQTHSFIAVKVFDSCHRGVSKSFISECNALRNIRHRNLIKILSVCSSTDYQGNDFRAAVYELMTSGSLDSWLHPQNILDIECELRNLSLEQRLNIAIDIASALEYLHCHCQPPIVHCDLKPSNVLLDDDLVAHVGDFGLAKVLSNISDYSQGDQSSSVIIKGSIGYVAPEYGLGQGVSTVGDVYSFGILLLEMFTAKRPTDNTFQDDLNLHSFTRTALERELDIIDPKLLPEEHTAGKKQKCLLSVLRLGLSCSMEAPSDRMRITDVVRELHFIKEAYEGAGIFHAHCSK